MYVILGNKKLIPSSVSSMPVKFSKSVNLNGYYYDFNKIIEGTYPLELAFSQIQILKKYDLVFIEDNAKNSFLAIFLKNPTRKTIIIEKKYLPTQLNRYKEQFKNIAIVNNTDILEIIKDYNQLGNVDFISIEKLPDLIDPNKKNQIIKFYMFGLVLFILTLFSTNMQIGMHNDDLTLLKEQLNNEITLNTELIAKTKKNSIPNLPTKDIQNAQINQILSQVDSGGIR